MVEQRPFKALVASSSLAQPTVRDTEAEVERYKRRIDDPTGAAMNWRNCILDPRARPRLTFKWLRVRVLVRVASAREMPGKSTALCRLLNRLFLEVGAMSGGIRSH
jgi:hypothetical protein